MSTARTVPSIHIAVLGGVDDQMISSFRFSLTAIPAAIKMPEHAFGPGLVSDMRALGGRRSPRLILARSVLNLILELSIVVVTER